MKISVSRLLAVLVAVVSVSAAAALGNATPAAAYAGPSCDSREESYCCKCLGEDAIECWQAFGTGIFSCTSTWCSPNPCPPEG